MSRFGSRMRQIEKVLFGGPRRLGTRRYPGEPFESVFERILAMFGAKNEDGALELFNTLDDAEFDRAMAELEKMKDERAKGESEGAGGDAESGG